MTYVREKRKHKVISAQLQKVRKMVEKRSTSERHQMTTIVLCDATPHKDPSGVMIHISSQVDIVSTLKKQQDLSADRIIFKQCGLSRLFSGTSPVTPMWEQFHRVLKDKGTLIVASAITTLQSNIQTSDFRVVIQNLNAKFLLTASDEHNLFFRKIVRLEPTMVTPAVINNAIQRRQRVEDVFAFESKRKVCKVLDQNRSEPGDEIKLGAGKYGTVYYYPKWRSDVVVKEVTGVFPVLKGGKYIVESSIGPNGERKTNDFLEIFSSAQLHDLTTGTSRFGHTIHIPRFEGFFTCVDEMLDEHSLYIIEEKLDIDFSGWIRAEALQQPIVFKTLLWQCLYTLISLVKLGWGHGDASTANFLVGHVGYDYYLNHVNIGAANVWTYRLDGKEWKLRNYGHVAKISDFGFMQHFKDPRIELFQNEHHEGYRIPKGSLSPGADVGYFMINLGLHMIRLKDGTLFESMASLFQTWFGLLNVKASDHVKLFRRVLYEDEVKKFTLPSQRLVANLEKYDVSGILDSPYFDDVVSH